MKPPQSKPLAGAPFPAEHQLERMGLVRCEGQPCSTWVDPVNVPERKCARHQREGRGPRADRESRVFTPRRESAGPEFRERARDRRRDDARRRAA